jgi:hypothetical protein
VIVETLIGWLMPNPIQPIKERVKPNRYAPYVSGSVLTAALAQAFRPDAAVGIRGGLTGRSGSEADFATGQPTSGRLVQDVTARALEPAWFGSNLGRPPTNAAYRQEPVVPDGPPWGGQQRGQPTVRRAVTLEPTGRTPLPRQLAAGFLIANQGATRLEDVFAEDG